MPKFGQPLRKSPLDVAQAKMLQLQWEKISPATATATVWNAVQLDETEWSRKLRQNGIFDEMEDNFRAKQTVKRMAQGPKAHLVSVLDTDKKKRIGAFAVRSWTGITFLC